MAAAAQRVRVSAETASKLQVLEAPQRGPVSFPTPGAGFTSLPRHWGTPTQLDLHLDSALGPKDRPHVLRRLPLTKSRGSDAGPQARPSWAHRPREPL